MSEMINPSHVHIILFTSSIYLDEQKDEETGEGVKCVEDTL